MRGRLGPECLPSVTVPSRLCGGRAVCKCHLQREAAPASRRRNLQETPSVAYPNRKANEEWTDCCEQVECVAGKLDYIR